MTPPTIIAPAETRTLVEYVRWETYVALADDRSGSRPRVTYDRGAMELFASMGVPELWRHDARQLRLDHLQGSAHVQTQWSTALPEFPLSLAQSVLRHRRNQGETALIREFRAAIEA